MLTQSLLCFSAARQDRSGIPVARQRYIEPVARHDPGRMDHVCPKCGALHWLNERVQKAGSTNLDDNDLDHRFPLRHMSVP